MSQSPAQPQPQPQPTAVPHEVPGLPVQPLTEWLQVMTEEVQRKEEAARVAAAESERRR
jgi:hypothetical protein